MQLEESKLLKREDTKVTLPLAANKFKLYCKDAMIEEFKDDLSCRIWKEILSRWTLMCPRWGSTWCQDWMITHLSTSNSWICCDSLISFNNLIRNTVIGNVIEYLITPHEAVLWEDDQRDALLYWMRWFYPLCTKWIVEKKHEGHTKGQIKEFIQKYKQGEIKDQARKLIKEHNFECREQAMVDSLKMENGSQIKMKIKQRPQSPE
jgi:hypothetical protein